jgi:KDO2-lipid IV(A) lauroyltransferase
VSAAAHAVEAWLARGVASAAARRPWPAVLSLGARIGDVARTLGLRRRVAEDNLERAFPEREAAWRARVLAEHYRELGRVFVEYPRLAELVHAADGVVVAEVRGVEHLDAARAAGRGAILLGAHYGNFELVGAWCGQRHPLDFVVKPLSNPRVEAMLVEQRRRAGVGQIALGSGVRRVYAALRANRWVALVADQDARRHGVFVPFLGRPASTPIGPAELSLRTGAPIVMGFTERLADGRQRLTIHPPLWPEASHDADAVRALTARHVAALETVVRANPAPWFWLHRRWKTQPHA